MERQTVVRTRDPVAIDPDTEEYVMTCAEALLAGTLALMTAYGQNRCGQHGHQMAQKICANLRHLARHPGLSAEFRVVVGRLYTTWDVASRGAHSELPASAWATRLPECTVVQ